MKKFIIFSILGFFTICIQAQSTTIVDYYDWSNAITYQLNPRPLIAGYGEFSDSLSALYPDKEFYEYHNEYYPISSWADYYYWFTQKYYMMFDNPELYAFFYQTDDDYGMATYIASNRYKNWYYPSKITVRLPNWYLGVNNLGNNRYIPTNSKQESRLMAKIETKNNSIAKISEKDHSNVSIASVLSGNNNTTPTRAVVVDKKGTLTSKSKNITKSVGSKDNLFVSQNEISNKTSDKAVRVTEVTKSRSTIVSLNKNNSPRQNSGSFHGDSRSSGRSSIHHGGSSVSSGGSSSPHNGGSLSSGRSSSSSQSTAASHKK